ncbi:MAG: hypothetical protein ABMA01_23200 [Chthoniobacteraceae bacterium]
MNIPQLGPLHPDSRIPEWLVSEPVSVPYFDGQQLTFTLDGMTEADAGDVQSAVEAFLALGSDARLAASQFVFQNYRRMVDAVGDDDIGFRVAGAEGIWAHVHPSEIFVSRRPRRDHLIYIQITAECDWEREHGLQIVYRRGNELSRVSDQDGHLTHTDAYDIPEDQDRIA